MKTKKIRTSEKTECVSSSQTSQTQSLLQKPKEMFPYPFIKKKNPQESCTAYTEVENDNLAFWHDGSHTDATVLSYFGNVCSGT